MTAKTKIWSYWKGIFFGVGAIALTGSIGLGWLVELVSWPREAESLKPVLLRGLSLTRIGLVMIAVLTLLTPWWLRRSGGEPFLSGEESAWRWFKFKGDTLIWAAGLFVLNGVFTWMALSQSLIWDELNTLTRVVHRGPVVIVTWSNEANNHPANSMLIWLALRFGEETETLVRFPAWLLGSLTAPVVFISLQKVWGRNAALLAGFLTATCAFIIRYSTEARGYAGALLFSWVAVVALGAILAGSSRKWIGIYVGSSVLAVWFIATSLLVVAAHGVAVLAWGIWQRGASRAAFKPALAAVVWAIALIGTLQGPILAQLQEYAQSQRVEDAHKPFGLEWLRETSLEWIGVESLPWLTFWATLGLSGWIVSTGSVSQSTGTVEKGSSETSRQDDLARARRALGWSAISPWLVTMIWLALPGTRAAPRVVLGFLAVIAAVGVAGWWPWLTRLTRQSNSAVPGRLINVAVILVGLAWLGVSGQAALAKLYAGKPDLKTMARRCQGRSVLLVGPQADQTRYYFPDAIPRPRNREHLEEILLNQRPDVVLEAKFVQPDQSDPLFAQAGYRVVAVLGPNPPGPVQRVHLRNDLESIDVESSPPQNPNHPNPTRLERP